MTTLRARPDRPTQTRTLAATMLSIALVAGAYVVSDRPPGAPDLVNLGETVVRGDDRPPGDHYVVTATPAAVLDLARRDGVHDVADLGGQQYAVRTDLSAEEIAAIVGTTPEVDPTGTMYSLGVDDPYAPWQWPLDNTGQSILGVVGTVDADVDADAAYRAGIDGGGVVVAMIDTGVDFDHPDLAGTSWTNPGETCANGVDDDRNGYVDDCVGWDFANGDRNPDDPGSHYHGTHLASIISANLDGYGMAGLAPGARIMSLKVSNGTTLQMSTAAAAMRYAVDNGADIINASWGSTSSSSLIASAVAYAEAHGVLVVAAAGNSGSDNDATPQYPSGYPNANVISVANSAPDDTRAASSNYGATTVDLAAPGTNVVGAIPEGQHAYAGGTSMAAPHVTAALALLYEGGGVTMAQARSRLLSTVDRSGPWTGKVASGGRLNVAALLGLPDPDRTAPPEETTTTTAPAGPTGAETSFDGFAALTDAVALDGVVRFSPGVDGEGRSYRVEGQLLNLDDGVSAIEGLPLWADGVETATDAAGRFDFVGPQPHEAYPTRSDLGFATALPEGRYALVVSMVDAEDWSLLHAPPSAVFFDVAADPVEDPAEVPTEAPPVDPPTQNPTIPGPDAGGPGGGGGAPPTTNIPGDTTTTTAAPADAPDAGAGGGGGGGDGGGDGGGGSAPDQGGGGEDRPDGPGGQEPGGPAPEEVTPTTADGPDGGGSAPAPPDAPEAPTSEPPAPPSHDPGPATPGDPAPDPSSPTPLPPEPSPVADGAWRIDSISPRSCAVSTRCTVTIHGSFPATPNVWFGSSVVSASDVVRTSGMLLLTSPEVAAAGTVDVSLRGHGADLTQRDAFTFTGTGSSTPVPGVTVIDAPDDEHGDDGDDGGGGGGGADTTTTTGLENTTTTTEAGAPATTTTTVVERGPLRRATTELGDSREFRGLRLTRIVSGNPLVGVDAGNHLCRASSCAGVEL